VVIDFGLDKKGKKHRGVVRKVRKVQERVGEQHEEAGDQSPGNKSE